MKIKKIHKCTCGKELENKDVVYKGHGDFQVKDGVRRLHFFNCKHCQTTFTIRGGLK